MTLAVEAYVEQAKVWPTHGRHILAQYDERSIVVYQAYKPSTRDFSVAKQQLGGPEFSFNRMSWIKPNFLWMMYRCGWASKLDQETVLALRIERAFFEAILERAVFSTFDPEIYDEHEAWKTALARSDVRLQWDPDHDPSGSAMDRRAIQLGLRGDILRNFATREMLEVIDMTDFVKEQRGHAAAPRYNALMVPRERIYKPASDAARRAVGLP